MPIPTRAASKSGSARRLFERRHGVVTTPAITCSDPNGSPLVGMASRQVFLSGSILIIGLRPGVDPDDCPPPAVTGTVGGPVAAECAGSNPARLRFSPAAFLRDSGFPGSFSAPRRNLQSPKIQENAITLLFQPPPGGTFFS